MIDVGFEKIFPTPAYPSGVSVASFAGLEWNGGTLVKSFKGYLKGELRRLQLGRCCFCRRHLGDVRDTHLEHYLEKSVFPDFTFEICNLGLSCSTCNGKKNEAFAKLSNLVKKRQTRRGVVAGSKVCPALIGGYTLIFPIHSHQYRWVHPHFDCYSQHIGIRKSWFYQAYSRKGQRTIQGLRLNLLGEVERRFRRERLAAREGLASLLIGAISEKDKSTAQDLLMDLAAEIRNRKTRMF